MYKYRVIELPENGEEIKHPEMYSQDAVKEMVKRIVSETHNMCMVERFNGHEWQRWSILYMWYFNRVCFYNR